MSPTQLSLEYFRDRNWAVCVVERWIGPAKKRIDAFGFGDLLAMHRSGKKKVIALVQTTTLSHMGKHRKKILSIPEFYSWKACGGTVYLHGWRKIGQRGKKTWQAVIETL